MTARRRTAPDVALQEAAGGPIAIADLRPEELVDIDSVVEHPENPRAGDVDLIVESIQQHGIYRRLVVQRATPSGEPRMRVLAGNHTRRAAKQLGYRKVPVEFIDCTDAKARKILLVDNRANDEATYRDDELVELLRKVSEDADGLLGTGYTEAAAETLFAHAEGGTPSYAQNDEPRPQWLCVVTCDSEAQLQVLYDELTQRGFPCKLVT